MEAEPIKAEPPKRKRRWFQFSLRRATIRKVPAILPRDVRLDVRRPWPGSMDCHRKPMD